MEVEVEVVEVVLPQCLRSTTGGRMEKLMETGPTLDRWRLGDARISPMAAGVRQSGRVVE